MLKKLASLLFEEEEEIMEEGTVVKSVVNPKKSDPIQLEPPQNKPLETVQAQEDIEFESLEPMRSSFGISADGPHDDDETVDVPKQRHESTRLKKDIYDFHPVISPMFGVKEELHRDSSPRAIPEAMPILPRSLINTVISPIYGDMETKAEIKLVHVQAPVFKGVKSNVDKNTKEVFNFEEVKVKDVQASPKIELEKMDLEALLNTLNDEVEEPLVNLSKAPIEFAEEDAHQFSLFDETK